MEEVMVRFGELALKSEPVRRRFKNRLMGNLKRKLAEKGIEAKVRGTRGRIFIETKALNRAERISARTFGVVSVSKCKKVDKGLEKLKEEAKRIAEDLKDKESFRIRARRADKGYGLTSKELEEELGSTVQEKFGFEVDLEKPDFTIYLEIRKKNAYIFTDKIRGVGGLPEGVEGKIASVIRNKNGVIASWLMMRRGAKVIPLFFKDEIKDKIKILDKWSSFDLDSKKIEKGQIENTAKGKGANALVSGLALFKEEDLRKIKRMKEKLTIPIFFPLVGYSKEDLSEFWNEIKSIG